MRCAVVAGSRLGLIGGGGGLRSFGSQWHGVPSARLCRITVPVTSNPLPAPAEASCKMRGGRGDGRGERGGRGGGGNNFAGGKISPSLKSPRLKVPYAQRTAIQHTKHGQETDSTLATHCHNAVTELLPKSHQDCHVNAEVCVPALCTATALCTGTPEGTTPQTSPEQISTPF